MLCHWGDSKEVSVKQHQYLAMACTTL